MPDRQRRTWILAARSDWCLDGDRCETTRACRRPPVSLRNEGSALEPVLELDALFVSQNARPGSDGSHTAATYLRVTVQV